jgi:mannan endo-1,4-beta-mannosidase
VNADLPIVFGEVANRQPGDGDPCAYDLDGPPVPDRFRYQDLLATLQAQEIGWLAWSWWPDDCAERQMTATGNFSHVELIQQTVISDLTTYGDDAVNNPTYGLKARAVKSAHF